MKKLLFIIGLLLTVSIICNVWQCSHTPEEEVVVEHDTVWRDTTLYEPQPAETIYTGKTVYLKVPVPAYLPGDTIHDSIEVPIPICQKRYEDSLYTAWVSGYEPALDSINLRLPTITKTVTITSTIYKEPLFTFGLQAGAGYGIINRKPDMYLGIGGTMRLWRSKHK